MRRTATALAILALGIATGVYSLHVARDEPSFSFFGTSAAAGAALLCAGSALIACGLAFWGRWPASRFGPLLTVAGFAWFLVEWNNPGNSSSAGFTIGLALYAACPAFVAHAVLAYPGGRIASGVERGALVVAYTGSVLVLGVLPALLFDPEVLCSQCPDNLLRVTDDADVAADLNRVGVHLGLAWASALAVLAALKLIRASAPSRRAAGPVFATGAAYLGLVAAAFAASLDRGFLTNGTLERRLWLVQAAALAGIAAGVCWNWVKGSRARLAVARLVVDLARSAPPGGLRDILAGIVGDPELVLAYPLADSGRLVDARGRPVDVPASKVRTTLVRDGRPVAVLAHAPGLLDDQQLVDEVTAAARLALENERLQAEVSARVGALRASRTRIVEAGDAERKRLERDLHDGAQQRLVGLSLSLRLARSEFDPEADPTVVARLEAADAELRNAVAELRELAHGIFPAVLADEGLAAAVEALAEEARVPIRIRGLAEGRFAPPVETTAYTAVAELARIAESGLLVRTQRADGSLVVEVETDDIGVAFDLVELEDRVGALDGQIAVDRQAGRVTIRTELPCGL